MRWRWRYTRYLPRNDWPILVLIQPVQVLTGMTPFGKLTGPEVGMKVLGGKRPSKPPNALNIGFSDEVWRLVEGCWQTEPEDRPTVKDVLLCLRSAASANKILSPVGGVVRHRYEEPDPCFNRFGTSLSWCITMLDSLYFAGQLFLGMIPGEFLSFITCLPVTHVAWHRCRRYWQLL
jgi:hypothetical protein